MRILIYTADPGGPIDRYNIRRLIAERPQHSYFLLAVERPRPVVGPVLRLKRRLVEFRDGTDHWLRANGTLDRLIRRDTPATDLSTIPQAHVAAVNDEASQRAVRDYAPDLIVQAGAGILKSEVFDLARIATINVHHGFAPEVRGMRSTFWCLYYGLTDLIGVTCHKIDATLDTGEVIVQERYAWKPGDDYVRIQLALCRLGGDVLLRSVDALEHPTGVPALRSEVDSFYFGELDPQQFNVLHRNGYRRIADPSGLPRKRRTKLRMAIGTDRPSAAQPSA